MIFMGIKEVNPLVKNLFQTGLKAFFPFRRGGRFIFFLAQRRRDAKGYRKQSFAALPEKPFCYRWQKIPLTPLIRGSCIPGIPSH